MEYQQTELNLGITSTSENPHYLRSPQYDSYWDELLVELQSTCKSVGEQVSESTDNSVHQQEYTHFIESYWVKRRNNKYWYYRYAWVEDRKICRKYIGSVNSLSKYKCTLMAKEMIEANFSPREIVEAIANFNS